MTARLPLRSETPDAWAASALNDPLALLSDQAYLERKAASNALELLNRWPEPERPAAWTPALSAIARDEAAHLSQVIQIIQKRGGHLERLHRSAYAADLRALVRRGQAKDELVDRLLVSALIEARSCERFGVLERNCADRELKKFYGGLWASEFGHHGVFLTLAAEVRPAAQVEKRWNDLLEREAEILARQAPGPRIHSGMP